MKRYIVLLIILATLFCICACQKTPVTNGDFMQMPTIPTGTQPTDPTIPVQTVDPRVVEMQELLEYKDRFDLYNYALLSEFSSPADVNLYSLFAYGFKDESKNPTSQEIELMGSWIVDDKKDLRRLPVEKMNAALTEVFGITLDQTNLVGTDRMWFFEETNCYYAFLYSGEHAVISVQQVEDQDDGTINVYYRRGKEEYQDMIVTLRPVGESYQILSNVYASPMVGEMQDLLTWMSENRCYNTALTSLYDTSADVDLFMLFYNGFKDESHTPTELELELLEGKLGQYWKEMDLIRLPVEKMDSVLMELFGITLEQTNGVGLDKLFYLEETDCYYHCVTGMHYADVTVVYVVSLINEDSILVQYSADHYGYRRVKLSLTEDGNYRILSNVAIDNLYNVTGIYNAVSDYFTEREAYLLGTSTEISNIMPGIMPDEAAHLAAINSAGVQWLGSEVSIQVNGYWDSHAEVIAIETVNFSVNGAEQTESVAHMIHAYLSSDGVIIIGSDGYQENTTGFTSASYLPPE